jgi:hypothetical protein
MINSCIKIFCYKSYKIDNDFVSEIVNMSIKYINIKKIQIKKILLVKNNKNI